MNNQLMIGIMTLENLLLQNAILPPIETSLVNERIDSINKIWHNKKMSEKKQKRHNMKNVNNNAKLRQQKRLNA